MTRAGSPRSGESTNVNIANYYQRMRDLIHRHTGFCRHVTAERQRCDDGSHELLVCRECGTTMALVFPDGSWTPLARDLAQVYPGLDERDIRITVHAVALGDATQEELWRHADREELEEVVRQVIEDTRAKRN